MEEIAEVEAIVTSEAETAIDQEIMTEETTLVEEMIEEMTEETMAETIEMTIEETMVETTEETMVETIEMMTEEMTATTIETTETIEVVREESDTLEMKIQKIGIEEARMVEAKTLTNLLIMNFACSDLKTRIDIITRKRYSHFFSFQLYLSLISNILQLFKFL